VIIEVAVEVTACLKVSSSSPKLNPTSDFVTLTFTLEASIALQRQNRPSSMHPLYTRIYSQTVDPKSKRYCTSSINKPNPEPKPRSLWEAMYELDERIKKGLRRVARGTEAPEREASETENIMNLTMILSFES